jgi:hypothetical protein
MDISGEALGIIVGNPDCGNRPFYPLDKYGGLTETDLHHVAGLGGLARDLDCDETSGRPDPAVSLMFDDLPGSEESRKPVKQRKAHARKPDYILPNDMYLLASGRSSGAPPRGRRCHSESATGQRSAGIDLRPGRMCSHGTRRSQHSLFAMLGSTCFIVVAEFHSCCSAVRGRSEGMRLQIGIGHSEGNLTDHDSITLAGGLEQVNSPHDSFPEGQ